MLMSHVDTFPLELAGWIVAAAITTEALILVLSEFCGLKNPFAWVRRGSGEVDDRNQNHQAQGGAERD